MATVEKSDIERYRDSIQKLLRQYAKPNPNDQTVETQLLTDQEHDHYQLVDVGWRNDQRIYSSILHIDIKEDKVWIQHNMTDQPVAEELVALGIPPDKIVLGFHPVYVRPHTGFAVN
ncbi:XisI protein [Chloroflexi bacterium TSY]|nr:XisI protein [Chloroflexi bacterium TSY]